MLALVNTPTGNAPVELRQVPEPAPGLHEALVAVQALSLDRRELAPGAPGGVGHRAVERPARSGAVVAAVAGRMERAAGLRELGATDVVVGIEQAQGRFGLILEAAGGASLATALHGVDANGAVVVFGNSSGETTSISFADFRGGQNARLQSFFS